MSSVNLQCSICLDNVTLPEGKEISSFKRETLAFEGSDSLSDSTAPVATKCNHAFHESCLKNWIAEFMHKTQAATCPTCRSELIPAARVIVPQRAAPSQGISIHTLSQQFIQMQIRQYAGYPANAATSQGNTLPVQSFNQLYAQFSSVRGYSGTIEEADMMLDTRTELHYPIGEPNRQYQLFALPDQIMGADGVSRSPQEMIEYLEALVVLLDDNADPETLVASRPIDIISGLNDLIDLFPQEAQPLLRDKLNTANTPEQYLSLLSSIKRIFDICGS